MLGGGATKHQGVIPVTTGKKITTKAQSKDLLSSLTFSYRDKDAWQSAQ
jgi:hypothetical protein